MIYLGYKQKEKINIIETYIRNNDINNIYFITNDKFRFDILNDNIKYVTYKDIIEYAFYYNIIENTTKKTLIILNEILRDTNRYNLTYNCIRTFLNGTKHILIFNYLPILYNRNDFCSLIDFDTQTRFKYINFDNIDLNLLNIKYKLIDINLNIQLIDLGFFDKECYQKYKIKLFDEFDSKDVHVIPRKLQLFTSKLKSRIFNEKCIGRSNKKNIVSFKSMPTEKLKILDLPFNMGELINYLYISEINVLDVISTGLKVDLWFEERVNKFIEELKYVYDKIR